MTSITESRVARELIAANRARKRGRSKLTTAQRASAKKYSALMAAEKARADAIKAEKKANPKAKALPTETVEAWLAQGGKIERLPEGASCKKYALRFDHSGGNALIRREFCFPIAAQ